jgi:hypothetical protein
VHFRSVRHKKISVTERTVAQRAVAHVASRSSGGPLDPELRVTLNFHPDRLFGGLLVLEAIGCDGVYLKRVWHYVARFGSPG